MKVILTKDGMVRMSNHIGRLKNAQKNGYIDKDVQIPTETDILLELISAVKNTPNGYVECMGDTYIEGIDYELEDDETEFAISELRRLRDYYIVPNKNDSKTRDAERVVYNEIYNTINERITELMKIDANDDSYMYDGEMKFVSPND